jgi:hypothetical protein
MNLLLHDMACAIERDASAAVAARDAKAIRSAAQYQLRRVSAVTGRDAVRVEDRLDVAKR